MKCFSFDFKFHLEAQNSRILDFTKIEEDNSVSSIETSKEERYETKRFFMSWLDVSICWILLIFLYIHDKKCAITISCCNIYHFSAGCKLHQFVINLWLLFSIKFCLQLVPCITWLSFCRGPVVGSPIVSQDSAGGRRGGQLSFGMAVLPAHSTTSDHSVVPTGSLASRCRPRIMATTLPGFLLIRWNQWKSCSK